MELESACELNSKTLQLAGEELDAFLRKAEQALPVKLAVSADIKRGQVELLDDVLLLTAPSAVEALHTVYAFAEKYLGFCFFEPGRDLHNPKRALPIKEGLFFVLPEPRLKRRGFIQEFPFSEDSYMLAEWMVRNRLNYLLVWMKYYDQASTELKEAFRIRGIEIESGHHNFDYWIPLEKYSATHPEFFAVIDGKRIKHEAGDKALFLSKQLCTTNQELRDEIVKNMVSYARAHPEVTTLSLIPNDGFGWCECERCSAFYDKNEKGEWYSVSEHVYKADRIYHDLFAYVGEKLTEQVPNVSLTLAAYINYCSPSPGFELKRNMAVHFAPYWRCTAHKLYDSSCPINSRYAEDIQRWVQAKDGGEVNIYEYLMGVNLYVSLPNVFHEAIFDEIDWLASSGVDGYLTQFHIPHWTAYGLNYYCMAKAAAGGDKTETLDALFQSLFGQDAELARTFYAKAKALVNAEERCHITYPRSLLKNTGIQDYEALHSLAEKLCAAGPENRFRQELLIWTEYLLRFKKLFDQYESGEVNPDGIQAFQDWVLSIEDTRVFVHAKVKNFLNAWLKAITEGKPWLHYNIPWEDEYVRRHDTLLQAK